MQPKHSQHALHSALIHHQLGPCTSLLCWLKQQFHCALKLILMLLQVLGSCNASNMSATSLWLGGWGCIAFYARQQKQCLIVSWDITHSFLRSSYAALTVIKPKQEAYLPEAWPCEHHVHKHASSHCVSFCMARLALPARVYMVNDIAAADAKVLKLTSCEYPIILDANAEVSMSAITGMGRASISVRKAIQGDLPLPMVATMPCFANGCRYGICSASSCCLRVHKCLSDGGAKLRTMTFSVLRNGRSTDFARNDEGQSNTCMTYVIPQWC